MNETAQHLREAREAKGLSLDDVWFYIRANLPEPLRFSKAKIGRAERGEGTLDPFELRFLAWLYNVELAWLDPEAPAAIARYEEIVSGPNTDPDGAGGVVLRPSRWNPDSPSVPVLVDAAIAA